MLVLFALLALVALAMLIWLNVWNHRSLKGMSVEERAQAKQDLHLPGDW